MTDVIESKRGGFRPGAGRNLSLAPVGDATRTARSKAYLERLAKANGKRVVVDFDAPAVAALEELVARGYADTQSDVIRRAIQDASKRIQRQPRIIAPT